MKTLLILVALFGSLTAWSQNPFNRYQTLAPTAKREFYPQHPPFKYPFQVSEEVDTRGLDPKLLLADMPEETLNGVASQYLSFEWRPEYFLYAYPFALHPTTNFLPYPFLKTVENIVPSQWVSHYGRDLGGEGIASAKFQRELDELTHSVAYTGNEIKHLRTPDAYAEIFRRLEATRDHAFISTYLFHCDKGTAPLLELIEKKATQGVRIFVLIDRLAAKSQSSCPKRLRALGAKVLLPRTTLMKIFHDKMFVFDGEYAQIDGQNLIAPGILSNGTNNLFNDVSLRIKGPVVIKAGSRFISNWENLAGGEMDQDLKDFYKKGEEDIKTFAFKGKIEDGLCRVVTKGIGQDEHQIRDLFLHTARSARNYLFFNYFDPLYRKPFGKEVNEQFMDAVVDNANANPDLRVDMLTNGWLNPFHVELPPGYLAPRNFISRLILTYIDLTTTKPHEEMRRTRENLLTRLTGENFHWWSYAQFMHSKSLMADNIWTIIGSYNIDPTAEKKSHEMVVACLDRKLAEDMQKSFIVDALNSIPIPLK